MPLRWITRSRLSIRGALCLGGGVPTRNLWASAYSSKVWLGVGFSDATGAAFELRVALPGVGEALKREIAGLVWVDR